MSIGLEFQTNWTINRELNAVGHAPPTLQNYPKETALFGSRNGLPGYCMETDGGDVEFVVEPPIEESDVGRIRLGQVMDHMVTHITRMDGYNCPMRKSSHPQVFSMNPPAGALITPAGIRPTVAQPQITIGVRLGRMQEFVAEIGRIGLLPVNPNALFDRDGIGSKFYSRQYNRAAQFAAAAGTLPIGIANAAQAPSNKLKGLLTMTCQYLLRGAAPGGSRDYAKDLAWAMARTDFASMFAQIKPAERNYFTADPNLWVHYALLTAGMDNAGDTGAAAKEFLLNVKVSDGGTLTEPIRIPITRGTWLYDMAKGVNAIDRFTETGSNTLSMRDAKGTHRLRALGQLGNSFDAVGLPRGPLARRHLGVVIELRQMRRNLSYTQWKQVALDVFDFTREINERSDKAHDPAIQFTGTRVI